MTELSAEERRAGKIGLRRAQAARLEASIAAGGQGPEGSPQRANAVERLATIRAGITEIERAAAREQASTPPPPAPTVPERRDVDG